MQKIAACSITPRTIIGGGCFDTDSTCHLQRVGIRKARDRLKTEPAVECPRLFEVADIGIEVHARKYLQLRHFNLCLIRPSRGATEEQKDCRSPPTDATRIDRRGYAHTLHLVFNTDACSYNLTTHLPDPRAPPVAEQSPCRTHGRMGLELETW